METIYTMIARFYTGMYERDENEDVGAGIVEYALLVAFIAVVAGVAIKTFGGELSTFFSSLGTKTGIK